eukprot:gb/GECG01010327.1/.p1 GENE.gb/GECG01010327.1/~~gb/GECG01010327.1/.p1  ORF type:complete len:304 (+),score=55.53 gb/GECG01010327.1/:1-912(+)
MDKKALFGDSDGDSSSDDSGDNFRPKPAASNTATAADTTATSKDPKKELLGDSDGDSDDANAPATATGTGSSAPKEEEEEDKVAEETKPTPSPATGAGSSAAKEEEAEKKSASSLASKEPQSLPEFTEKERVAMKLLEQTPPGQLDEVISDLKKLLPSVSDPAIRDACNRYAAKSFEVVPLPADNKHSLLLSEDNCIPQSALSMVYVSSATKKAYSVDAVTKVIVRLAFSFCTFQKGVYRTNVYRKLHPATLAATSSFKIIWRNSDQLYILAYRIPSQQSTRRRMNRTVALDTKYSLNRIAWS